MKKLRKLLLSVCLVATPAFAADFQTPGLKKPSQKFVNDEVIYGSVTFGGNAFFAPSQYGLSSVTAPFLSAGGKFTLQPQGRLVGGQADFNISGASSRWLDPKVGSNSSLLVYGGAAHVFTAAFDNMKLGAFYSFDEAKIRVGGLGTTKFPTHTGGLEGQYAMNPNLLLRGRAGIGSINSSQDLGSVRSNFVFGGAGVTYAVNKAWNVGADVHYTDLRLSNVGVKETVGVLDLGVFTEHHLDFAPVSLRADIAWIRTSESKNITRNNDALDAYRAKISLRYEFGGETRKSRPLLDREFQTYTILNGLR
jgi:hypothetical protein